MHLRQILPVFALLPHLTGAQTTAPVTVGGTAVRPKVSQPGTVNVYRDPARGVLMEMPRIGPPRPVMVDYMSVQGLPDSLAKRADATTTQQSLSVRTANASVAQIRQDASAAPADFFRLSDFQRPHLYRRDALDTSTPDDGVLCLVTAGGVRYKLVTPDGRITPQMFGAIPDDGLDDGPALLAWINAAGYELTMPPGIYESFGTALTRTNKGAVTITGAGSSLSILRFRGDTDGVMITNDNPTGSIKVVGIQIVSTGAKSAGRTALKLLSPHLQRPGPVGTDIAIKGVPIGQEWTKAIDLTNTSASALDAIDIEAGSYSVCTGITYGSDNGQPSVEPALSHFNIRNVYRGIAMSSPSSPGNEGVQLSAGQIIGCFQGVYGTSSYGSPGFTMNQVGINSMGGECIYLDGFAQVSFGKGCLLYSNLSQDGKNTVPQRAVYLKNAQFIDGKLTIITYQNTPYAVEFAGSGGAVDLDITLACSSQQTQIVYVPSGYQNSPPALGLDRTWDGTTTWGSTFTGTPAPTAYYRRKMLIDGGSAFPAAGSLLRFDGSKYVAVSSISANRLLDGVYVSGSQTLDPSLFNMVRVDPGSANITISIDQTKLIAGQRITFNRVNASTGGVTLTFINTDGNKLQQPDGTYATSFSLPATAGSRSASFYFDGGNLELIR